MSQQHTYLIYVIESPSALDAYQQRSEANLLRQAINLDQIPCVTRCVINRDAFHAAMGIGLTEAIAATPSLFPILHISAHGDSKGIGLSNDDKISWNDLRRLLQPINTALNGFLLVCMSSCEGYAGIQMAMFTDIQQLPFCALVGCSGKPTWSDTAVAYATFYHLLAKGTNIDDCVAAMKTASGVDGFVLSHGKQVNQRYVEFVNKQNAQQMQGILNSLRRNQQQQPPSQLTKLTPFESPRPQG